MLNVPLFIHYFINQIYDRIQGEAFHKIRLRPCPSYSKTAGRVSPAGRKYYYFLVVYLMRAVKLFLSNRTITAFGFLKHKIHLFRN